MSESTAKVKEISITGDLSDVVIKIGDTVIKVGTDAQAFLDQLIESIRRGRYVAVSTPDGVELQTAANDTAAKATHEIGAIESAGDHKGEIYGGIFPDGKPGWILEEPKPLTHYEAVELKGQALPTREEGKYINTIKDKGALKDIFARHSDSSSSAGYFWLAEHCEFHARYQQFSDGSQDNYGTRNYHLPVLSVRR